MIRVVSWQRSGVAWQPWRTRRITSGSKVFATSLTACCAGLESYGLPEVDEVLPNVLDALTGADVLHLHHAWGSQEVVELVRAHAPKVKVAVTVHGEPDRGIGRPLAAGADAYVVVEPGLLALGADAPIKFIPNHPGALEPIATRTRRLGSSPTLLIPFSHVPQHKDHAVADAVADRLQRHGWTVRRLDSRVDNDQMVGAILKADAVWVQLQGYVDILTMECWALGTVPVTLHPPQQEYKALARAMGFAPAMPFVRADAEAIARRLIEPRTYDTVPLNAAGMSTCWTPARATVLWDDFYRRLVAGAVAGSV